MLISYNIDTNNDSKPIVINKEDWWWRLNPLRDKNGSIIFDKNGNPIYFRALLSFQNTWSDQNNIHLYFEILFENNSTLPPNIIQSNVFIAGNVYPSVFSEITNEDNGNYKKAIIKVSVPLEKLTKEKFEEGVDIPLVIDLYLQQDILDGIRDSLESNALRLLLENLKDARLTTKIKLNNFIFFRERMGNRNINTDYEDENKKFISWYQPNYSFLSNLDQIKDILTINVDAVVTVFSSRIIFDYSTSVNGESKTLTIENTNQITYPPNTDIKFSLNSNYIYDTSADQVINRGINNHYFFLPRGGNGLYTTHVSLLINKVKYDLESSNSFGYFSWLDDQSKLDFIDILPKVIKSIGSYSFVE
ncbi:DUF5443 family protein [[Mycoplasma] imitans]|uniref:DUF5443 family protein n=1 Tax=[Mycoplasma] imitans TaxID=29560 RepID=UPI000488D74D|nr:DUF5443 family protein [[Mycoplasma] imitans]